MDIALSESGQDYEILLIENGSQDETWAVMQELKLAHPRIRPRERWENMALASPYDWDENNPKTIY